MNKAVRLTFNTSKNRLIINYLFRNITIECETANVKIEKGNRLNGIEKRSLETGTYQERRTLKNNPMINYEEIKLQIGTRKIWMFEYFYNNFREIRKYIPYN